MEKILILDFGSQYTQLIGRKVREHNVYCEIYPFNAPPPLTSDIKGVILSGSPFSVNDEKSPRLALSDYIGKMPVLGICYGAQLLAHEYGGEVTPSLAREYGRANLSVIDFACPLFKNISNNSQVWMSHGDTIENLPAKMVQTASTEEVQNAAFRVKGKEVYGIQFHPEVYHSNEGRTVLKNFVVDICGCSQSWTPATFISQTIDSLQKTVGDEEVILGLSGGVDSSVAAVLLHKAIGKQLKCIFVNNGLLRKGEYEEVLETYQGMGLQVEGIDASNLFMDGLRGISDPEEKRKSIGANFINVFEKEAKKYNDIKWLGQGTIYPDVIESISVNGPSVTIKSHHNVGGLPEKMYLKVVEPLKLLFKDEVRRVGRELGIKSELIDRHPFPGPGLGIRIIGEVTSEKVNILQEADYIYIQGLKKHGLYDKVWQACTILTSVQSVGVMGDERTYENMVALRAVSSTDGMTADWVDLPYEFLRTISNEIINNVRGINRVVYDISSKPPATIEWE